MITTCEWISSISRFAGTNWIMINDSAIRIYATCSQARIYAFIITAGFVCNTFRIDYTLRSTSRRTALVVR